MEVAAEALSGRCVSDLLPLEGARPSSSADLAHVLQIYHTTSLAVQEGAYGGHGGFRTSGAAAVRLLEGAACGRSALRTVAAKRYDDLCTGAINSLVEQVGRRCFSSCIIEDSDTLRRLRLLTSNANASHRVDVD